MISCSDYRYERKMSTSLDRQECISLVKKHPAIFSEIYYERYVNSIYFDSLDKKCYFDALDGVSKKVKFRIRWYGDLFGDVRKPILELKIREGQLIKKMLVPVKRFSISQNDFSISSNILTKSNIPEWLRLHVMFKEPVLLVRFLRKYFLSGDGLYRITIDSDVQYYPMGLLSNVLLCKIYDFNTILELKYNTEDDEKAEKVTNFFPFRIIKNSKYIRGLEKLNLW